MKRIIATACGVACLISLSAQAYDLEHKKDLNGMKVTAEATGGPNPKVVIANSDKVSAHCRVEFAFGQRSPAVRVAVARAGKRVILTAPVPEATTKLVVTTSCKPPKSKGEKGEEATK
jgi:hypothetical protein